MCAQLLREVLVTYVSFICFIFILVHTNPASRMYYYLGIGYASHIDTQNGNLT